LAVGEEKKTTFVDHIAPIFSSSCQRCHRTDKPRGGLSLSTFTETMSGGSSGEIVVRGDPDSSRLFRLLSHLEEPFMPDLADKLPDDQIKLIRQWIAEGALENAKSTFDAPAPKGIDLTVTVDPTSRPAGPPPMPRAVSLQPTSRPAKANSIIALDASPWAPVVAIGGETQVLLYHTGTLNLVGVLPFPDSTVNVLRFSRNGDLLAGGGGRESANGRVVLWKVATGRPILEIDGEPDSVLALDVSPDHSLVALGGPGLMVRIFSTETSSLVHEITSHTEWITSLAFSPDGVLLASADRSGSLFVWETLTAREYLELRGHSKAVTAVSWRADSNVLASSSEDGTIRLWEMEGGGQIKNWTGHAGGVLSLNFGRDGSLVSAGRDKHVRVWKPDGAERIALPAFDDIALRADFDHRSETIIAGDWTGAVRVHAIKDGAKIGNLQVNPPTIEERIAATMATLKQNQDALARIQEAHAKAKAEFERLAKDLDSASAAVQRAQNATDKWSAARRLENALAEAIKAERISAEAEEAARLSIRNADVARKKLDEIKQMAAEKTTNAAADKTIADKKAEEAKTSRRAVESAYEETQRN
jgi:hypothetical protein